MSERIEEGALAGIRVIEFDDGAAQYCGKLLADMGAEVIRVEPPEGSAARRVPPFADDRPGVDASLHFWHYNTNKRSVVLDLSAPEDLAQARELIGSAAVVLDGLGAGRLAELGLDEAELRAAVPSLVYARLTPFGAEGPWASYRASDLVLQALGGTMTMTGYDDLPGHDTFPIAPAGGQSWHVAGVLTAVGILAAVLHREATGRGQLVDVAAHEALAHSNEMGIPYWEFRQENVRRHTGRHGNPKEGTGRQMFRCRDGKYAMCLTLYLKDDKRFGDLVEWMDGRGLAGPLAGPEFRDAAYRAAHNDEVLAAIERFCAETDSEEIFHGGQARRLPWAPVNAPWEIVDDPQLRGRGAVVDVEHPEWGTVAVPGALYRFSDSPWTLRRGAPRLGEADVSELLP